MTIVDFLINNAAQTKRRPRAYYREVIEREKELVGGKLEDMYLIKDCHNDPFAEEEDYLENKKLALQSMK